ncbi:hypothetical protein niasHT_008773 [Heterodera trifolii]|uniref:Serine/threonine-protein phosphatase n=1 Tax=Heterodera trifolii TaxID=157864 RepID=A0ABD2M604_9BILA
MTFQSLGLNPTAFQALGLNSSAFQSQGLNSTAFHHWDSILHHSNSRDSISPEFQSLGHNSTQFSVKTVSIKRGIIDIGFNYKTKKLHFKKKAPKIEQGDIAFVDAIIDKVKQPPHQRITDELSNDEVVKLCKAAEHVFKQQATLIRIQPPVVAVGDIHGQFADLMRIFAKHGHPPDNQYVFLGDYVDKGIQSLETIVLLFYYKVKYPLNFVLLRGNHECVHMNKARFQEPVRFKSSACSTGLIAWMTYVALIGKRILCMHGGISDKISSLEQLSKLMRPLQQPPDETLEVDLLWSDPDENVQYEQPNDRGAGVAFGEELIHDVCSLLGLKYIIRAHERLRGGFEYFAGRKMITVYSAPRYTNWPDAGATFTILPDLTHKITRFQPT